MQEESGRREERGAGGAESARILMMDAGAAAGLPDPVDTLLEAHATVVAEIRTRAAQPDLDGREIKVLAKTLMALESAIDIITDGPIGVAYT
ncbi:MAG: hypothetical protein JW733_06490 [Coriobacteriia bacterium]|nr:hypothetical protein [Coriobacteriia bacterium]MBN2847924.1 hypothetical protein [Coriobacteriia bacterium]